MSSAKPFESKPIQPGNAIHDTSGGCDQQITATRHQVKRDALRRLLQYRLSSAVQEGRVKGLERSEKEEKKKRERPVPDWQRVEGKRLLEFCFKSSLQLCPFYWFLDSIYSILAKYILQIFIYFYYQIVLEPRVVLSKMESNDDFQIYTCLWVTVISILVKIPC